MLIIGHMNPWSLHKTKWCTWLNLKNRVSKHRKINTLIFRDCKFIKKTKQNDKMQKNNQIIMKKDLKLTKDEELPFSLQNFVKHLMPYL